MHGRESDWKKFTKLKKTALERFCTTVLNESRTLCGQVNLTAHERYLELYKMIQKRDEELGYIFDGHSRSLADQQLRAMYHKGLITDEELSRFSHETQNIVRLRFDHDTEDT